MDKRQSPLSADFSFFGIKRKQYRNELEGISIFAGRNLLPDLCICNTEKAQNLIITRTDSCQYTFEPDLSTKGGIYWAVTAVNRFGYESTPLALNVPAKDNPVIYYGSFPAIPSGYILIVSDATGMEILRTVQPEKDIPQKTGKGFFRFSLLAPDGTITPAGVTVY